MAWYVVHVGRQTGVFPTWDACHAQVDGFRGACYKKFKTREEAVKAFYGEIDQSKTNVVFVEPKSRINKDLLLALQLVVIFIQTVVIVVLIVKFM